MAKSKTIDIIKRINSILNYLVQNENHPMNTKVLVILDHFKISLEALRECISIINVLGYPPHLPQQMFRVWIEEDIVVINLPSKLISTQTFLEKNAALIIEKNEMSEDSNFPKFEVFSRLIKYIDVDTSNFDQIDLAINNRRKISCSYDNVQSRRSFLPIKLFMHNGKYYVSSIDVETEERRILLLHKISDLRIEQHFSFNEKVSQDFIFYEGENIKVSTSPESEVLLREYPNTQLLEDGTYVINRITPIPFYQPVLKSFGGIQLLESSKEFEDEVQQLNETLQDKVARQ